jgi:cobalamin 5'-phosphate synthase/cobalamin synthase
MIGPLLSAVAFLTRIPVFPFVHADATNLQRSARWFPVVGFLLGSIYAGAAWLSMQRFPAFVVAVLLLVLDVLLTGALHLDGLADMADGFGGGRTREDVLRIMRDHAIGSYGAVALILVLLFKLACLSDLVASKHGLWILIVAPALSRWSILLLSRSAPYAREILDGAVGTGALCQSISRFEFAFATALCIVLPFAFGVKRTLACWCGVAALTLLMARICRRRIGGITGDTLGANAVISEALQFALAIAMNQR